jgi:hypothetical protein
VLAASELIAGWKNGVAALRKGRTHINILKKSAAFIADTNSLFTKFLSYLKKLFIILLYIITLTLNK